MSDVGRTLPPTALRTVGLRNRSWESPGAVRDITTRRTNDLGEALGESRAQAALITVPCSNTSQSWTAAQAKDQVARARKGSQPITALVIDGAKTLQQSVEQLSQALSPGDV